MISPKRSTVVRIVAAALAVGGVVVVARAVFGCGTRAEAKTVAQFRADPFFAAAPPDGTLVQDQSQLGSCDPGLHGDSGIGTTFVARTYHTPGVYGYDELRLLFDRPATTGGWSFEAAQSYAAGPNSGPRNIVTYCKQTGPRVFHAYAVSPPESTASGILVVIRDSVVNIPCGQSDDSPALDPALTCPYTLRCVAERDVGPLPPPGSTIRFHDDPYTRLVPAATAAVTAA